VFAQEVSGELETPGTRLDIGFDQDSKILTTGLLYGGSIIGVDFEYGLSRAIGVKFGVGIPGADVGFNVHLASDLRKDLYFSFTGIYEPALENLFMPAAEFGMRWYIGRAARVGIGIEAGTAVSFQEVEKDLFGELITIKKNQAIPIVALGVVFKLL